MADIETQADRLQSWGSQPLCAYRPLIFMGVAPGKLSSQPPRLPSFRESGELGGCWPQRGGRERMMARTSTSALNPDPPVGIVAEVRQGAPACSGEKGGQVHDAERGGQSAAPRRGGRGGGVEGCPAAIPAASWPPLAGAQVGGRQLPAPSSPHPRYLPSPPKRSVRRLRASGAEPTTLQPRGGREPASRAPLVRDPSSVSSFPHPSAAVRRRRGGRLPGRPGGGGRGAGGRPRRQPR